MHTHPIAMIFVGAIIQAATIVAMRKHGISFWVLLPALVAMLWLFMTAYASKAMSFTALWFIASGMMALLALACGYFAFGERIGITQVAGIVLVATGIVALKA